MQKSGASLDFAQFAQFPHGLQTKARGFATRCCSLFPVVLAFCNYRRTTLVALNNREIREHAGTENKIERNGEKLRRARREA
jgi:hypothetical protein